MPPRTLALMALVMAALFSFATFPAVAQDATKPANDAAPAANAPADFKIPPQAAKKTNPVKPTPMSIAAGKKNYAVDCAVCHGADGDGKGDLAADMKIALADFRNSDSLKSLTDGEIFYIIQVGKGQMPGEGDRAKPEAVWNLVNYIRSLSKKSAGD
ncbi:MAG: cytochrome c [Candidatus Acidiferrales bacterium]